MNKKVVVKFLSGHCFRFFCMAHTHAAYISLVGFLRPVLKNPAGNKITPLPGVSLAVF